MVKTVKAFPVDLLLLFCLLLAGMRYVAGLEQLIDIGLYDESDYLYNGVNLLQQRPPPSWAPLYAVWYFCLSFVQPDRVLLYYLNYQLVTILPPLFIYILLRRHHVAPFTAVLLSFFFLISLANLDVWPKVSHFALMVILLTFIIASFTQLRYQQLAVVSSGALLAAYVRPEMFLSYGLLLLLLLYAGRKEEKRPYFLAIGLVTVFTLLLTRLFGFPLAGNRNFGAFGQHFAGNWVRWTNNKTLSPWTNWAEIMRLNFGDAQTVPEAFLASPMLVIRHLFTNIMTMPQRFVELFFGHTTLLPTLQNTAEVERAETYILLTAVLLLLWLSRNKWQWRQHLQEKGYVLLWLGAFLMSSLISIVAIWPRKHYLLLFGALLLVMVAIVLREHQEEKRPLWQLTLVGLLIIVIVPAADRLFITTGTNRDTLATIRYLQSLDITDDVALLEAQGGFHIYLGNNYQRVAEFDKDSGFNSFHKAEGINMIILTPRLATDTRFRHDPEWLAFLDDPSRLNYAQITIPNSNNILFIHERLQPEIR